MIEPRPLRIGTFANAPIWVHPEAVLLLLVGMPALIRDVAAGIVLIAALFLSILAHEMGHAIAARRCGSQVLRIDHVGIAGLCTFSADRLRPQDRCVIAAAGPAANLLIAALCSPVAALASRYSFLAAVTPPIAVMNVMLALGNLLPIYPLDGSHILFELLSLRWPRRNAVFVTSLCGVVLSVPILALTLVFCLIGYPVTLAVLLPTNWRMLRDARRELWPRRSTAAADRPASAQEITERLMAGIVEDHRRQRTRRRPPA